MPDTDPGREQAIREAVAAYEKHPVIGFDCCEAHAVADAAPELLAELDRVRAERDALKKRVAELEAERDELAACARRVATSHQHFIEDHQDPGTEALGAQYELINTLSRLPAGEGIPPAPGIEEQAATSEAQFRAAVLAAFTEKVVSELSGCCHECDACIDIMRNLAEAADTGQASDDTPGMNARMGPRERLTGMVRTDRGDMTVWSPAEVHDALDAYRAAVLAEAANALALGPVDSPVSAPAAWTEAIETLRSMAEESQPRPRMRCGRARSTGKPCPDHDGVEGGAS